MRRRAGRILLLVVVSVLLAVLLGPFFVPVPPLQGTVSAQSLADPDSQFIEINGIDLHFKKMGQGEPVFLLLHGFGSSLYSWDAVMEPLSQVGTVIAFDRPGFGLTERPLDWEGQNPYSPEAQLELVTGLLDHFRVQQAFLVGNSAGGTAAMQAALAHPERVAGLVLVAPAVYSGGGTPAWVRPLLTTPQMRHLGPLVARQIQARSPELIALSWHNPDLLTSQTLALYQKPFQVENWDRALWEFTLASRPSGLAEKLEQFSLPVLVVTGDDDRVVPTAESVRLASELPNARLSVIGNAGHVPHEERPADFMNAMRDFLNDLD
jgi:pimeloyl-ACP methyl ester carboxylesterase